MSKSTREEVYKAIDSEREYQKKWDESESNGKHTVSEFVLYMQDYLTQAIHQLSRNAEPQASYEALQTVRKITAMGVACMEQNGAYNR